MDRSTIFVCVGATFLAGSIILFLWPICETAKNASISLPIDLDSFSAFGSFVGGIFGSIGFLIALEALRQSKLQSHDATFFNHMQVHDSVVRDLQLNAVVIGDLNKNSKSFLDNVKEETLTDTEKEQYKGYRDMGNANSYFEIQYRILHIRYMYLHNSPDLFYQDNSWRLKHYFISFFSVLEHISRAPQDRKLFYTQVLKGHTAADELRLTFYFLVFSAIDESTRLRWAIISKTLNIFDDQESQLIKPQIDWQKYMAILK